MLHVNAIVLFQSTHADSGFLRDLLRVLTSSQVQGNRRVLSRVKIAVGNFEVPQATMPLRFSKFIGVYWFTELIQKDVCFSAAPTVGGRQAAKEATRQMYQQAEKSTQRVPLEQIRNHVANAHAAADEAGQKVLEAELNKLSALGSQGDTIPLGEAMRIEQRIGQVARRGTNYDAAALREARNGILDEMGKVDPAVSKANAQYFRQEVQPKVLRALRSRNSGTALANLMEKDPRVARAFQLSPEQTDEWIREAQRIEKLRGQARGKAIADLSKDIGKRVIHGAAIGAGVGLVHKAFGSSGY